VATAVEALYPENVTAWKVYGRLSSRFVVDAGLAGEVFRQAVARADSDTVDDLVERLGEIHEILMPERKSHE
jgi:hypothetical protein